MNKVKCEECKFGIEVNPNARVLLCDNPNLKTYGKNVKHGRTFSCGYGILWSQPEEGAVLDAELWKKLTGGDAVLKPKPPVRNPEMFIPFSPFCGAPHKPENTTDVLP